MRFKLSNKVKGLCMRDRDSERDPWEYRKVVDLEWSTRKSYGNKKGWLAVCELLESYHRADVQIWGWFAPKFPELYFPPLLCMRIDVYFTKW